MKYCIELSEIMYRKGIVYISDYDILISSKLNRNRAVATTTKHRPNQIKAL